MFRVESELVAGGTNLDLEGLVDVMIHQAGTGQRSASVDVGNSNSKQVAVLAGRIEAPAGIGADGGVEVDGLVGIWEEKYPEQEQAHSHRVAEGMADGGRPESRPV